MLQFFALLFALVCLSHASVAQRPRFSAGIKAGVGLSGTHRTDFLENNPPLSVMTDRYRPRRAEAVGLRLNYRLTHRLALTLDAEYQRLRDYRQRDWTFLANGGVRFENQTRYENRFSRLQFPLTLRFDAWQRDHRALYVRGGIMFSRLLQGRTDWSFSTSQPVAWFPAEPGYDVPLDIPANRPLRAEWQPVAGVGWQVNRHLALELTAHFGRKLSFDRFNPGSTHVIPPTDHSWANRDGVLSAVFSF